MEEENYEKDMKSKLIENGLMYLKDLNLLDTFYEDIWSKYTPKLLERYLDKKSYHDIPGEKIDDIKGHVIEWFGEDYGLAFIDNEFWMISVGSIDEGGYKWWYKIRINTNNKDIADKVVLFDKCMPGKYCNLYLRKQDVDINT